MAVIPKNDVRKSISFQARYTSGALNRRLDALEGASSVISGLEVIRTGAGTIRVFPGVALVRGRLIELTTEQDLTLPSTAFKPYALYLRTNHESPDGATFLEFASKSIRPRDAVLIRHWADGSANDDLMFASAPDTILGTPGGVHGRVLLRAIQSPTQAAFDLGHLAFPPGSDELFVFANKEKQKPGTDFVITGLKSLALTTPINEGELLELLVLRGVRFREEQTGLAGALITLTGPNSYTPVIGDLLVFKNRQLLSPGPDYAETTSTSITLTVPAVGGDIFEIYGVTGLRHRETTALAAASTVGYVAHGYRPGSHDAWVFQDGDKLASDFDYTQPSSEEVELAGPVTASIHTVLFQSFISFYDVGRDLAEIFDLGRDGDDAFLDPDENRPGATPPDSTNPFITLEDLQTNLEVIAARGNFDLLGERLNTANEPSLPGTIIGHGEKHRQGGSDAIPIVTSLVGGLMSAIDKANLDDHVGSGGAAHLEALPVDDPASAGFMSAAGKVKFDQIELDSLYNGAWALKFFSDFNQLQVPSTFATPEKGDRYFYYLTSGGSVNEVDAVSNLAATFTARFTMFVEVTTERLVLWSLTHQSHTAPAVWIDGVKQSLGFVTSGRSEGSITFSPGVRRVDVVFYGIPIVGSIAGTRCGFQTDLLTGGITFSSAPDLTL